MAWLLTGTSWAVLVAVVAAAAWVVHGMRGTPDIAEALAVPRATVQRASEGHELAPLIEQLAASVASSSGRLVDVEVGTHVARRAPVRLRVEMPGRTAEEIDRLVRGASSTGIDELVPLGMTPVVGGLQLDLEGAIELRHTGKVAVPSDDRALIVVLKGEVEDAEVRLRRLEMPARPAAVVRLDVSGSLDGVLSLLAAMERQQGPLEARSVRLRSAGPDAWDLDLLFGIASHVPTGRVGVS